MFSRSEADGTALDPRARSAAHWRVRAAALLAALAIVAAATVSADALYTDTESVTGNQFSTGTVDIGVSPAATLVTMSGMMPGDKVTAAVTVTNSGSLQLRYAITSTTTESSLAAQLDVTIKSGVATCSNAGFGTTGTLAAATGDLGSTGGLNIMGNPAAGSHSGDRTLNSGASEELCVQVSLPSTSSNAYEGLTTTATLTFAAEQTANNS